MTNKLYKLQDSIFDTDCKYVLRGSCQIGMCYQTEDTNEWFFSTRYPDDFYSAEELLEIVDLLKQLNLAPMKGVAE